MTRTSTEDTQILKGRTGSVSVGPPDSHKGLFEPSEHLWQVQGLILNVIPSPRPHRRAGASPLPLDMGYLFWWEPTFSIDGCSPENCNFGVLTGEDECIPSILPSNKQPTV